MTCSSKMAANPKSSWRVAPKTKKKFGQSASSDASPASHSLRNSSNQSDPTEMNGHKKGRMREEKKLQEQRPLKSQSNYPAEKGQSRTFHFEKVVPPCLSDARLFFDFFAVGPSHRSARQKPNRTTVRTCDLPTVSSFCH